MSDQFELQMRFCPVCDKPYRVLHNSPQVYCSLLCRQMLKILDPGSKQMRVFNIKTKTYIKYKGKLVSLKDLAALTGIKLITLYKRYNDQGLRGDDLWKDTRKRQNELDLVEKDVGNERRIGRVEPLPPGKGGRAKDRN